LTPLICVDIAQINKTASIFPLIFMVEKTLNIKDDMDGILK